MASKFTLPSSSFYSFVPVDPTIQLTINDLPEVLDLLSRHRLGVINYHDLGLCLGLSLPTLNAIRINNKGDTESCLRECLTKWLEEADDVKETKGGPTIYSLVSALRELGENEVANGIDREKHPACKILARHSNRTLVLTLPQLAGHLYKAKLIKQTILVLLNEVQEAVCADYRKLEVFADILCMKPATAKIGYSIKRDYREACASDYKNVTIDNTHNEELQKQIYVLRQKLSAIQRDHTITKPEIVEKWLSEGSVELTVTRVNMHGPPGAGKTCAQDLLLNNPPTTHTTDSTPIARPAVKATRVSVDNEAMKWEKVDRDGLLERLASDLKEAASQPKGKISATQHEESGSGNSSSVSSDEQQTSESQDESTSERDDSATETDESTEYTSDESFSISEGVIQEIVGTIQSSEVQLNLSGHWLYIIDSGGQPAYQELLPLFVRTASLNIITLNLSQPLDKKLDFKYRIGGKTFSCGINFKYSNRDFFLSAVSSGAILNPIDVPHVLETPSHPMNFVLGTHYDLITEDKLKEMNKELMSSLKPDIENYVIPNVRGESIIFPVNTLVPEDKGRMKAGQDLCQSIANCGGTSLKINVPIRWFAFELWLQKVAEDKSRSYLIIDEAISAGARFKMSEDDTKDALQYLHNVTIILYYPDILPQLVFVDPKPILEVLSRLLALTYVERKALHLIANPVPPEEDINELHDFGFFKEELLTNHFKSHFSPPHFEPSHLLKLLIHLHIIASGEDGDYFIPCALQAYTEPPNPEAKTKALLIVWLKKIKKKTLRLPVPQGIFPLLITYLLTHKKDEVEFPDASEPPDTSEPQYYRYRDALSLWIRIKGKRYTLHIINRYSHIEVYLAGSVQKAKQICPYIRELVMKAVSDSADALNVEHNHATAFSCPKRSTCYCVVANVAEEDFETNCTSCADSANISGDSYWCWFGIDCSSKIITSDSHYSVELNTSDLDAILTDLKDGDYPSSDWKDLGLKLGLNYDTTLKNIESNYSKVEDHLRECLSKWLQRVDGVDDKGGATWSTLVNALEQCDSGKPTAEHIRCKRLKRTADQSQTDDNELCPPTTKKNKLS